jgi:putative transposase
MKLNDAPQEPNSDDSGYSNSDDSGYSKSHDSGYSKSHDSSYDDYLKRLPPEYYRGRVAVHWSMTIQDRKQGWLIPIFYYKFREILTHTMFRYGLCCPIYCCMPDHIHLLWLGILKGSDQRNACKFFRRQLNLVLQKMGVRFQQQSYDHVLREEERERTAFEEVAEYIARNPERAGLVQPDGFREYPYTGCLVPGYPDLKPWQDNYWELFWRIYSQLSQIGLVRTYGLSPEDGS